MTSMHSDSDLEFDDADEYDGFFTQAAEHVQRTHDLLAPDDLLDLYGLYKQATVGRCQTSKPSIFNIQARAKWSAWNDLSDMSAKCAKRLYIEKVQKLDPVWYEELKSGEKHRFATNWVVHSVQKPPEEEQKPEDQKTVFDYVKEGNLSRVRETLRSTQLQDLDDNGLGLIHWATDQNAYEVLEYLLDAGAAIDLRDAEQQQTALHYAASCGHLECIRLLLQHGADPLACDVDGQTSVDVAFDNEVRLLLESFM